MNDQEFQQYEQRRQLKTLIYFIPTTMLVFTLIGIMSAAVISGTTDLPLFEPSESRTQASLNR